MKIGVLNGGSSEERDVSLKSGKAIISACEVLGHNVISIDPKDGIDSLIDNLKGLDLVFNGLHGGEGENGVIQGLLQSMGVKFTGSGNESSAICMDKRLSKALVQRKNILTPDWLSLDKNEKIPKDYKLHFPLIVKPNDQGSTIGLTVAKNNKELSVGINLARKFTRTVMIERFIDGREITVTIIGDKSYPIVEIFPKKGLYDYESKYTKGFTDYFCPADIKSDLTKTIQSKALKIHKLLECRHYSRVDFILDKNLKPWFLEVNTLPGMTETSLVPKSAAVAGLSFEELIEKIIMESLIDE